MSRFAGRTNRRCAGIGDATQGFDDSAENNTRLACWRRGPAQGQDMIRFGVQRKKDETQQADAVRAIRAQLGTRSIVLVGMPGSGKSAVGRRLAAKLELSFVDADEEIENAAGKPITDIFKDHGEAYFRQGERKVIARLLRSGPQVLATGGGAFMTAETRENIREAGISIWLKAELLVLMRRVLKRNNRPLLENDPEGVMRRLMETRYPVYATADITVESRDLPHETIVGEIVEALVGSPQLAGPTGTALEAPQPSGEAT
jgi:shikimate kinase